MGWAKGPGFFCSISPHSSHLRVLPEIAQLHCLNFTSLLDTKWLILQNGPFSKDDIGSVTSLKENTGSLKTTLSLQGGEKSPSGIDRPLAIRQVSETQGDMKTFKAKEG